MYVGTSIKFCRRRSFFISQQHPPSVFLLQRRNNSPKLRHSALLSSPRCPGRDTGGWKTIQGSRMPPMKGPTMGASGGHGRACRGGVAYHAKANKKPNTKIHGLKYMNSYVNFTGIEKTKKDWCPFVGKEPCRTYVGIIYLIYTRQKAPKTSMSRTAGQHASSLLLNQIRRDVT